MTTVPASRTRRPPRTVSRPHDPAERQADRVADAVARGGSVAGWSLGGIPLSAGVHREDAPPTEEQKLDKLKDAGKAWLETDEGRALKARILADPLVKSIADFFATGTGKVVAGGAIATGIGVTAATGRALPVQLPAKSLDRYLPGLSVSLKVDGPLTAPSYVGLSLSYSGPPPSRAGPTAGARYRAETERMRAELDALRPKPDKAETDAQDARIQKAVVLAGQRRLGFTTLIPLLPGLPPKTVPVPAEETQPEPPKQRDDAAPVQREPLATSVPDAAPPTDRIDDALAGGAALDPAVRHSMEARFGADFAHVRLHAGARQADAARALEATAFTVGDDIVFAGSIPDAGTYEGRHLLAHELAHVVQQRATAHRRGAAPIVHRRGFFENLGILFGLVEGTWTDRELKDYLARLTAKGRIDTSYDADNKARALVRKWKAATPGWDLSGRQKGLLIDELLDGPTGDDDEDAILDLLERSDAGDLRAIFAKPKERWTRLDEDLDWSQHDRLLAFVATRFQGGRKALDDGRADITDIEILGPVVPADAPVFAFDAARLEARLDGDDTADEIAAVVEPLPAADRQKATDHLLHVSLVATMDERGRTAMSYVDATGDRKEELKQRLYALNARSRKLKRLIPRLLLGDVPAKAEDLRKQTKALPPDKAKAAKDVLAPKQYEPLDEDQIEILPNDDVPAKSTPDTSGAGAEASPKTGPRTAADRRAEAARKRAEERRKAKEEQEKHGPDSKYRKDVQAALVTIIADSYQSTVIDKGTHADPSLIEPMAEPAKNATDAVFGQFYSASAHPALSTKATPGKPAGIPSWHAKFTNRVGRLTDRQRVEIAVDWILYYARQEMAVRLLNDKHDATPRFGSASAPLNVAARTLVLIARDLVSDGVTDDPLDNPQTTADRLLATKRDWGGMSSGGKVYVDLYLPADRDGARLARWAMLQTLVHEYIHTLVADEYDTYARDTFSSDSTEYTTLIEGVDEVFTLMVWARLAPNAKDPALRRAVEGATDAALPPLAVPPPTTYDAYGEAIRLVELVGIGNVMAAYFLGLVDRIRVDERRGGRRR